MAGGTLSSTSLDRYSSVALAGLVTEYIRFGQAEGGLNDIQQLDSMLRALQVRPAQQNLCIYRQGVPMSLVGALPRQTTSQHV